MGRRKDLHKKIDEETSFRCGSGVGILREEVWIDMHGQVTFYNLAFLLPHLLHADNGRILGYDNAHGFHERHFLGSRAQVEFTDYKTVAKAFHREAELLRRKYENANSL